MTTMDKVNRYIKDIEKYLISKHGSVNDEWRSVIDMYADNLILLDKVNKVIEEVGIFDYEKRKKNPLLSTKKETEITLIKLGDKLGLSPAAQAKIKLTESDNTEDFIAGLVS